MREAWPLLAGFSDVIALSKYAHMIPTPRNPIDHMLKGASIGEILSEFVRLLDIGIVPGHDAIAMRHLEVNARRETGMRVVVSATAQHMISRTRRAGPQHSLTDVMHETARVV